MNDVQFARLRRAALRRRISYSHVAASFPGRNLARAQHHNENKDHTKKRDWFGPRARARRLERASEAAAYTHSTIVGGRAQWRSRAARRTRERDWGPLVPSGAVSRAIWKHLLLPRARAPLSRRRQRLRTGPERSASGQSLPPRFITRRRLRRRERARSVGRGTPPCVGCAAVPRPAASVQDVR